MYADAPYAARPRSDAENIVGLCLGTADVSATFKYVIYAATREFATRADDSVFPSQPFRGTLDTPLQVRRSILASDDIGTYVEADGSTILNNDDAFYDALPSTFTPVGRPIVIKAHRRGDDYANAVTVFRGVMASWFIDESQVSVALRDFSYKLRVPAQARLYAGTGAAEGGSDLAQKRKPLIYGYVLNWSATLISASMLIYQVHDGAINAIGAVYDRGVPLTFDADYPDYAALAAASVPSGRFATCLAGGLFRLGANATGTVTADVEGDKTGGTFASSTADILRRWIVRSTKIADPDDLFVPSFDALNVDQPAPVGYGIGPDDTHSMADVVADMMRGIGGYGGFRRDGTYELKRVAAARAAATDFYTRNDIISLKREQPPSAFLPAPYRQRVAYSRNWTVQTDLLGSVTAERKAFVSNNYRLSEASASAILNDFEFPQDPPPRESYFRDKADADAEAQRLLDFYRVEPALYRLTLPRRAFAQELGDTINVTFPRWDLSLGRNMLVVEMNENVQRSAPGQIDTIEVVALG